MPAPRAGLDRRGFLRGLIGTSVALTAAAGLSGCAAATGPTGRPLQLWHLFSGADGEQLLTMLSDVEDRHPEMRVDPTCLAWGSPYYTKVAMASAGGKPPDLAVMHLSRLSGYAPGGLLQPYDQKILADLGVTRASFTDALWGRALYDGELYGLPLDTHPFIAFYNLDLADKARLLQPDGSVTPITSPDQFMDVGRRLAEASGNVGISFGFLNDTAQPWRLFWGLYGQTGGQYRFDPGRPAEWDTARAVEIITFVRTAMDGTIMSPGLDYNGGVSAFTGGRAGMILSGEWELPGFQKSLPRIGASPMPTMFGHPASYADSHSFVLPKRDGVDPARLHETYQLAVGLIQDAVHWAEGGHIPAYLPVTAEPAYIALSPQSSYARTASSVFLDPPVWFAGAGSDFQNQMSSRLIDGYVGRTSPADTAASMLSAVTAMLRTPNPA